MDDQISSAVNVFRENVNLNPGWAQGIRKFRVETIRTNTEPFVRTQNISLYIEYTQE